MPVFGQGTLIAELCSVLAVSSCNRSTDSRLRYLQHVENEEVEAGHEQLDRRVVDAWLVDTYARLAREVDLGLVWGCGGRVKSRARGIVRVY